MPTLGKLAGAAIAITAIAAAGLTAAPPAAATTYGAKITVTVEWTGGDCWARSGVHPAEHDARRTEPFLVEGCYDYASSTQFVVPGAYFGADPAIGDADAVSCKVVNTTSGRIIASDYARLHDGTDANCLGRWAK